MDAVEFKRVRARERKRQQRERERRQLVTPNLTDDEAHDQDATSDAITPPGLVTANRVTVTGNHVTEPRSEGATEYTGDLMQEQALWVFERRRLTALEYARRRGDLIPLDEARLQSAALARRIRAALDRAPQLLPADLSPDIRSACSAALGSAIKTALAHL